MRLKRPAVALLTVLALCSALALAQDQMTGVDAETSRSVPALEGFHTVVYKIWHTAWPEKNVRMLADLLPEVKDLGGKLLDAKLPGIFREKINAWNEQMSRFKAAKGDYEHAATPPDSIRLLAAAERLHTEYEKLVRVLRPALRELDEFHVSLYKLYHHYLPDQDLGNIKATTVELQEKAKVLNAAVLPARLKDKEDAFEKGRTELSAAVGVLADAVSSGDMKLIKEKTEAMHSRYQELEKVFE